MTSPFGPGTATPPGVADVLRGFCQQARPADGYDLAAFDERIQMLAVEQQRLLAAKDSRAVFHLVYLSFSRQVRRGFDTGRFVDPTFAADMSCRFIDAYLEQGRRFADGDPSQCTAWREAFGGAVSGEDNVIQTMFRGMNAHIHYDLAFVTLGSCRAAGDLDALDRGSWRSLSMTGISTERHLDFLAINQIAWESLSDIRETVLGQFSAPLQMGGQLAARLTDVVGQRVLMEARDTAWRHATLLIHGRDESQRSAIGALIEAYATHHTDLIDSLRANPRAMVRGLDSWMDRGEMADLAATVAVPDATRDVLMEMARSNPVVGELALRELAFAGYDPVMVLADLMANDAIDRVDDFLLDARRYAPRHRRKQLDDWLATDSPVVHAVLTQGLRRGTVDATTLAARARAGLRRRWMASLGEGRACLAVPEVCAEPVLLGALGAHEMEVVELARRAGVTLGKPGWAQPISAPRARQLLAAHPDKWIRVVATLMDGPNGDEGMRELIDRVLFLRGTPLFTEVATDALLAIADDLLECDFAPGQALVHQDQQSAGVHLLRHGRVELVQMRDQVPVPLFSFGPGAAVGELSALTGAPAAWNCLAVEPTQTWLLPTDVLARLLDEQPRAAVALMRMISRRLVLTTHMVSAPSRPNGSSLV